MAESGAQLIYYIVLLVVIGGAMLFEFSGRGGQALRRFMFWVVIFAGATIGIDWYLNATKPQQRVVEGGRIEIPVGRDGHFRLMTQLNDTPVEFIVDTGASTIALGPEDARRIGIDTNDLAYIGTAYTANGTVRTANVRIDEFAIGDHIEYNVPATVIDGELDGSLLGMSYLRGFARVSFEGDLMILER